MARECAGDDALAREVASLLAFHEETQDLSLTDNVPATPEVVGEYRILSEVGRGGMGVVLLARRGDSPPVALKLLRPEMASAELLARFQREAVVLARLDHPGVARLLGTGVAPTPQGPRPWLAMEYIEGVSLREWAKFEHSLAEKLDLLARIADAVEHAHAHGVVHRDLKPENVIVRPDGAPVVLDFGVARLSDSDVRAASVMTSLGVMVGTIRYMSPEQAEGRVGAIGPRSDVYTLGVVACELLEGRLPYEVPEESVHRALAAVMTARMRPLSQVGVASRRPLERVLRAALAKQPEQRTASASALAEDLRRVASGRQPKARAPKDDSAGWSRVAGLLPVALVAAGLAILTGLAFRQSPTPIDWMQGAVQPDRMFRRIMDQCDSATVRIHYNTRTLPRLREARVHAEHGLALLRSLQWQPYHAEVQAHLRFRLGEARYLIAERTYDMAEYEAAVRQWLSARELPQPPPRVPIPDTVGVSAREVVMPILTQPWAAAAMALDDMARLGQAERSHARALEIRREGAKLFAASLGERSLMEITPADNETARDALSGWLQGVGASLVAVGANRSDPTAVREGLTYLRRSAHFLGRDMQSSARASRFHDLGTAFLWAGLFEQADSLVDSSTVRLRTARTIRLELPGYTSFVHSSRELARALRLQAWRAKQPRLQRALLLEALAQLSPPTASEVRLGPLDEALLNLAAAEVMVDLGCVERDSSRFTQACVQLERMNRAMPPRRAPNLAEQASVQLLRIEGQRYAITGSSVHLTRSSQALDQWNLWGINSGTSRWAYLASTARTALMRQPAQPYALTFPISTPF